MKRLSVPHPVKFKNIRNHKKFPKSPKKKSRLLFMKQEPDISSFSSSPRCKQRSDIFEVLKLEFYPGKSVCTCKCELKDHTRTQKVHFPQSPEKELLEDGLREEENELSTNKYDSEVKNMVNVVVQVGTN